jgi:hypothetical protein
MRFDLTDEELELLTEVLESVVSDLSPEIADTDNPIYRRELIARRNSLRSILEKVAGAAPLGG